MTQENKELLLKDLCARLPYGVKVYNEPYTFNLDNFEVSSTISKTILEIIKEGWKPYLRPLSSMTEGEAEEMFNVLYPTLKLIKVEIVNDRVRYYSEGWKVIFFNQIYSIKHLDFLLEHHFDFRGLIEKGLALEALKGMYGI